MSRFLLFVWVLPFLSLASFAEAPPGESIFNLQSQWTDQNGMSRSLTFLKGQPSVVAMAYTNCKSSCPLIVEEMRKMEADIIAKKHNEPRFVLFSFDSQRDTPEQLRKFAESRKLDLHHWTLLHGDANAVRELAAVLGIRYRRIANGEFIHSNVISLLDPSGVIQFQQTGLSQKPDELENKLAPLAR